jgi:F-box/leucine-rich repeat protein 2/20
VCINEALREDELRAILGKLESDKDKEAFGLVCKKWLYLQSTERKRLAARAGTHMLRKMAARFTKVVELDLSQSPSRSFSPGLTDSDLSVIARGFTCLRLLSLYNCKGIYIYIYIFIYHIQSNQILSYMILYSMLQLS